MCFFRVNDNAVHKQYLLRWHIKCLGYSNRNNIVNLFFPSKVACTPSTYKSMVCSYIITQLSGENVWNRYKDCGNNSTCSIAATSIGGTYSATGQMFSSYARATLSWMHVRTDGIPRASNSARLLTRAHQQRITEEFATTF
jgi:hypothetical protein